MLRDLVLNFTLILIIVFLVHHYLNQLNNRRELSFTSKVIIGISMSMLGTVLYYLSIVLEDGTVLNFRSVAYLLAAYYGGGGTAFITFVNMDVSAQCGTVALDRELAVCHVRGSVCTHNYAEFQVYSWFCQPLDIRVITADFSLSVDHFSHL